MSTSLTFLILNIFTWNLHRNAGIRSFSRFHVFLSVFGIFKFCFGDQFFLNPNFPKKWKKWKKKEKKSQKKIFGPKKNDVTKFLVKTFQTVFFDILAKKTFLKIFVKKIFFSIFFSIKFFFRKKIFRAASWRVMEHIRISQFLSTIVA